MKSILCFLITFLMMASSNANELPPQDQVFFKTLARQYGFKEKRSGVYSIELNGTKKEIALANYQDYQAAKAMGFFADAYQLSLDFVDSMNGVVVLVNDNSIGTIKNGSLSGRLVVRANPDGLKLEFKKGKDSLLKRNVLFSSDSSFKCCFIKQAICEKE